MTLRVLLFFAAVAISISPVKAACSIVGDKSYGDCSSVTVQTAPANPERLIVTGQEMVSGIIVGADVQAGSLMLSGISQGAIIVMEGGTLVLSGIAPTVRVVGGQATVSGMISSLQMDGGSVHISGQVGSISGTGKVRIENGALIGNIPMAECDTDAGSISVCERAVAN